MIIVLIRIALLWLRRLGVNVPTIPTLRRRQTVLERFLSPPPPVGGPDPAHTQSRRRTAGGTGWMR